MMVECNEVSCPFVQKLLGCARCHDLVLLKISFLWAMNIRR